MPRTDPPPKPMQLEGIDLTYIFNDAFLQATKGMTVHAFINSSESNRRYCTEQALKVVNDTIKAIFIKDKH